MIRDRETNALLNNDTENLHKYKKEREQLKKFNTLSNEVAEIKNQLSKICDLLEKTVEKR